MLFQKQSPLHLEIYSLVHGSRLLISTFFFFALLESLFWSALNLQWGSGPLAAVVVRLGNNASGGVHRLETDSWVIKLVHTGVEHVAAWSCFVIHRI
jgi:hypothetical protein